MNTYTVKVPNSFPAVSSAQVQARLRVVSLSRSASWIAADPGAGDRVLRLSLPGDQVSALATMLGNPPAVALRRLIATQGIPAHAPIVPARTGSTTPASWFDRHPVLALVLILAGVAGLLWMLFRRNGGPPSVSGPSARALLVSNWSPLQ
jgi:hypothetical protein